VVKSNKEMKMNLRHKVMTVVMLPVILLTGCAWYQNGGEQQVMNVLVAFAEQEALSFLTQSITDSSFDWKAAFTGGAISLTRNLFNSDAPLSQQNIAAVVQQAIPNNSAFATTVSNAIYDTVQEAFKKGLSRDTALQLATDALDKAIADIVSHRGKLLATKTIKH
jgi:hypothetical protein